MSQPAVRKMQLVLMMMSRASLALSLVDYDVVTDARLSRLSLDAPYTERRVVLQLTISTPVAQTVTESVTVTART